MTYPEHAERLWSILVELAGLETTKTYGEVGKSLGLGAQNMSGALAPIHAYCQQEGFPLLTALVVQTRTGHPGPGYRSANDHATDCARVYGHDWTKVARPTAKELASAAMGGRT